ncbi:MAG: NGG1p interacting factor NIF3 [bacterium]|nr:NGG1p interacting factor NIF3 [bacterium]
MKLSQLFKNAIEAGIAADPRGKKRIERTLKKEKDRGKALKGIEKELFDDEQTWNPYGDSRILHGSGNEEVTHLMIGVDIETPEILLADRLREKGEKIDALFIHHPEGRGLADLTNCMPAQIDVLANIGVPENQVEALLKPRSAAIARSIHANNLFRDERAAELLGFPAFTCHTPTDNLVWQFMEKNICGKRYDELGEILNALLDIEEFMLYAKKGNAPLLVNGSKTNRTGKIVATGFTGGTNGPEELIEKKAQAGVGTILSMHFTEKEVEEGKKHNLNMIQCSHMASDVCGMNLMLDILEKKGKLKTLGVSGFVRVKR